MAFDERPPSGSPSPDAAPGNRERSTLPAQRSEEFASSYEFPLPPLPVLTPLPDFSRRPNGAGLAPSWPPASSDSATVPAARPEVPVICTEVGRHSAAQSGGRPDESDPPVGEPPVDGAVDHVAVQAVTGRAPSGRSVLLLGATGSVGSAIARALAAAGNRLVLHHGAGAEQADVLLAALPGADHLVRSADLADPADVADLIAAVDDLVGGLDVVINAASDRVATATLDSGRTAWADSWSAVLSVDVLGAAVVAHAAAAVFRARRRGGRIILVPARGRPAAGPADLARESAAAAISALGRGLARELAPHGIGVTTVAAGPAAASGWSPDDLAATVVWLMAGPAASLPGAVLTIES